MEGIELTKQIKNAIIKITYKLGLTNLSTEEYKKLTKLQNYYQIGNIEVEPNWEDNWERSFKKNEAICIAQEEDGRGGEYSRMSIALSIQQAKELIPVLQDIIKYYK